GLSCTITPAISTIVNTVRYLAFTAPPGYLCTDPAAGGPIVSCWTTGTDVIAPGESRKFQFTVSLFDREHPYVIVDDSVLRTQQPVSSPVIVGAIVNPDGSIADRDASNDATSSVVTLLAPFIEFRTSLGPDCPVSGVG